MSQREPEEPPLLLDAARVLEYAVLDAQVRAATGASAVMGGVAVDLNSISGLAIVEGLARDELFLLSCNERWETLAAASVGDVAEAKAQAETAYPGVTRLWRAFRELTDEELAEIASTRGFLRELLSQDPTS